MHDFDCVFMCGLEVNCGFLIEIRASSFFGNRGLVNYRENLCAVGREVFRHLVGTSPPRESPKPVFCALMHFACVLSHLIELYS